MARAIGVLLVDGDDSRRSRSCERIEGVFPQVTVHETAAAEQALELLDCERVDCLVSAADLEDGDALGLLETVRERDEELPFVLLSEADANELAAEVYEYPLTGYVPDVPGAARALGDRIETLVGGERTLDRERERFHALFSNFPEPTIAYGFENGRTVFRRVNDAFEETFGLSGDDVRDAAVNDVIVPADHRTESDQIDEQVASGELVDRVVERRAADGLRTFNVRSIPVPVSGRLDGFAVYSDITERRENEEELRRQNERLEQFASLVSHDLRNPLNVAMGHVDLVGERYEDSSLEQVAEALGRMEELINETLLLARQGRLVTDTETVRLGRLVEGCWGMVETERATLEVEDDVEFLADPPRVRQLFENLFRNAVEHGGDDVGVRVGVDGDAIYVADDGSGIPEDERDEVFEAGRTTAEGGTGFGLAIVREIADAHDWDVRVIESASGGTRFELTGFQRPPDGNASE